MIPLGSIRALKSSPKKPKSSPKNPPQIPSNHPPQNPKSSPKNLKSPEIIPKKPPQIPLNHPPKNPKSSPNPTDHPQNHLFFKTFIYFTSLHPPKKTFYFFAAVGSETSGNFGWGRRFFGIGRLEKKKSRGTRGHEPRRRRSHKTAVLLIYGRD